MNEKRIIGAEFDNISDDDDLEYDPGFSVRSTPLAQSPPLLEDYTVLNFDTLKSQVGQYVFSVSSAEKTKSTDLKFDFRPQKDRAETEGQQPGDANKSAEKIRSILGKNEKAIAELYNGCPSPSVTTARDEYLRFLVERQKIISKMDPSENAKPITMEKLLGKDGIKKYKEAVSEEMNSREYRQAIFLRSCTVYEGDPNKKDVLYIGGPSGGGKSSAVNDVLKELSKEGSVSKTAIAIDGGVHRELSAMRQLTIGLADMHNFNEITDLESTKEVKKKNIIKNVAKIANMNVIHPVTFAETKNPISWLKTCYTIWKLSRAKNINVHFVQVDINKQACKVMGKTRSKSNLNDSQRKEEYQVHNNPNNSVDLRTKHESKKASNKVDLGIKQTGFFRKVFERFFKKNDNFKSYTYRSGLLAHKDPIDGSDFVGHQNAFDFFQKLKGPITYHTLSNIDSKDSKLKEDLEKIVIPYFIDNNLGDPAKKIKEITEACIKITQQYKGNHSFADIVSELKPIIPFIKGEVTIKGVPTLKQLEEDAPYNDDDEDVVSRDNYEKSVPDLKPKPDQKFNNMLPLPADLKAARDNESALAALPKLQADNKGSDEVPRARASARL